MFFGALKPLGLVVCTMAVVWIGVSTAESKFYRDANGYPMDYSGPYAICPHCCDHTGYRIGDRNRWRCPRCSISFPTVLRDGWYYGVSTPRG